MRLTLEEAADRLGVEPEILLGIRDRYREEALGAAPGPGGDDPTWTLEELDRLKSWFEERHGPLTPAADQPPN